MDDAASYFEDAEAKRRIFGGKSVFGDPVFWKALEAIPSVRVHEVLKEWYPALHDDDGALRAFRALGERFVPLLLDPGIACRYPQFLRFSRPWLAANGPANPFQLRRAFAESLPSTRVYRAISIPRADAKTLLGLPAEARRSLISQRHYLTASSLRSKARETTEPVLDRLFESLIASTELVSKDGPDLKGDDLSARLYAMDSRGYIRTDKNVLDYLKGRAGPGALIDLHVHGGQGHCSLLASYSHYPEVALSVPCTQAPEDQQILLMTVRIPGISEVRKTGLLASHGISGDDDFTLESPEGTRRFNGRDPDVEVFTFLNGGGTLIDAEIVDNGRVRFKFDRDDSFFSGRRRSE